MDDVDKEGGNERHSTREERVTGKFWEEEKADEGEADEEFIVRLPLQPYVKVFNLSDHRFLLIHASDLKAYPWDTALVHKLVLPKEHKDLVQMLVTGADLVMEDIVKGKTGGVIAILTGESGLGKTLTAEVFSEGVKKALYKVHCSQLGTNEQKLEENLQIVLARAERWKAILLIDEADVYVYERGTDIQQNAIVGVFLRILEYYRGILFMTSNRGTIIDDAIMARATAWIQYRLPDAEKLAMTWRVLADQFKMKLSEEDIAVLVKMPEFAHISGRSVKSLLKLTRLVAAQKDKPVTPAVIKYVSQFVPIEREEGRTAPTSKQ
jgi:replication-associated recombination protein RarA